MLELHLPSLSLVSEFENFVKDIRSAGESLWSSYAPKENESPQKFIERLNRQSHTPDPNLVPETIYWATHDGAVVGRISLRHELNDNLKLIGGHIGYEVRPSYRKRGFATEMLRLILLTPKAQEIGKLLLTCDPDNIGSNKTIISNGGRLTQTIYVEMAKAMRNHYWITF